MATSTISDNPLSRITPFLLCFNEEANLERTLSALKNFPRVVLMDSFSTDRSLEIAAQFSNVVIQQRTFDNFTAQCHAVLDQHIETDWVLSLDSDYALTPEFIAELRQLDLSREQHYQAPFIFCMDGVRLSGSLYPPRTVLFRRSKARYQQRGHTQWLASELPETPMQSAILHDDRKDWARFVRNQQRYGRDEAKHLYDSSFNQLKWTARIRKLGIIAPWLVPLLCLFYKGLIWQGRPGWRYTQMRWVGEKAICKQLWRLRFGLSEKS